MARREFEAPHGYRQKFFFDGNKRTSRFMMNGVLMNAEIDAFLNCHPEVALICQLNPGLSTVSDLPEIKFFSLKESIRQP